MAVQKMLEPLVDEIANVFNAIVDTIIEGLNSLVSLLPDIFGFKEIKRSTGKRGMEEKKQAGPASREEILRIAVDEKLSEDLSKDFDKLAESFEQTLSKTMYGGRKLEELDKKNAANAIKMLKSIENVEQIMGADRGKKNEFIASAAALNAMQGYLKKQNIIGEKANEIIQKFLAGRLGDAGIARGLGKAGGQVSPENIRAAGSKFAAPLGLKEIKETEVAENARLLALNNIGNAYVKSVLQAKQTNAVLQESIGHYQNIADIMARYRGDFGGALDQLH
jgi:hypothetical protein